MRLQGLDLQVVDGAGLGDEDIDAMWALRAQFMRLKPDVREQDDRNLFASWLRTPGGTVAIGTDRAGTIQAFIEMKSRVVEHRGRPYGVLFGNFVFASTAYRNHPAYVVGNCWNLAIHALRHRVRRLVWVVPLYPPSFVVGARTFPTFWLAGEPDVPEDIASLVDVVVPELYGDGWSPERKVLRMRTIPRPYEPSSPTTRRLMARYEARNPDWRDGYSLVCVVPITLTVLLSVAKLVARRMIGFPRPREQPRAL